MHISKKEFKLFLKNFLNKKTPDSRERDKVLWQTLADFWFSKSFFCQILMTENVDKLAFRTHIIVFLFLRANPRKRRFARNWDLHFTGKSQESPFCP